MAEERDPTMARLMAALDGAHGVADTGWSVKPGGRLTVIEPLAQGDFENACRDADGFTPTRPLSIRVSREHRLGSPPHTRSL